MSRLAEITTDLEELTLIAVRLAEIEESTHYASVDDAIKCLRNTIGVLTIAVLRAAKAEAAANPSPKGSSSP